MASWSSSFPYSSIEGFVDLPDVGYMDHRHLNIVFFVYFLNLDFILINNFDKKVWISGKIICH
jgi:hypothetical protein